MAEKLIVDWNEYNKTVEKLAAAVELLHIATLVHDDTVDDSNFRRGKATISNLWGDNSAVLIGDYIFAAAASLICETKSIYVIKRFSETIMELSAGELDQMYSTYSSDQTKEKYFKRIYKKTASLFTTASESGAILSNTDQRTINALKNFGYNLGMAFQSIGKFDQSKKHFESALKINPNFTRADRSLSMSLKYDIALSLSHIFLVVGSLRSIISFILFSILLRSSSVKGSFLAKS